MIGIFILNSNECFRLSCLYIIFSSYKHLVYYLFIYVSLQEVLSFNYHSILHASLFSCSSSRSTYFSNYLMSLYTDHYFDLQRSCIHQESRKLTKVKVQPKRKSSFVIFVCTVLLCFEMTMI